MKKLISLTLILFVSLSMFGCSNSKSSSTSSLERIKSQKKIILGTSADYPPYEFHKKINGKDTIVGFDIEIAKEIAKELGVELEIKDMRFDGLLPSLKTGKVDIVVAGMTPTEKRRKSIDFSNIYYTAVQNIVIKSSNKDKIKSIENLNGLSIGAQKGTIQEELINTKVKNPNTKGLGKVTDIIMALNNDRIDAAIMESPIAKAYVKNNSSLMIAEDIKLVSEDSGFAVGVQKDQKDLVEAINKVLDRLVKENKIDEMLTNANSIVEN